MQKKQFTELGLSPELLKAVAKVGYEEASPIQSAAIPVLLGGADVVGQSQTGSGKTAAFSIPMIERVDGSLRQPQALVLCPTRELAMQVAEEVARLAFFKRGVRELPIYGGASYERQFRGLEAGPQIIIGTPGRVMDHLERGSLRLDALRMIVLDEADRMLDMGFVDDIQTILAKAPSERQTVMFSATLPAPILKLIERFTKDPVKVKIEAQALTVPSIEQVYYEVARREKVEVLCRLIDLEDIKFGIIFCATKMMVDELTEQMNARGYLSDKLHGDMSQAMRERVMARFRKRGIEFLVATDVAARGLDVDDIEAVFNYDLPQDGDDYVHRIGRTGRAGRDGRAFTLISGREIWKLENIMRFTKGKIRRAKVPTLEEVEKKRANVFFESLRETLEKAEYTAQDELIDRLLNQGYTPTEMVSALIHLAGSQEKSSRGRTSNGEIDDAPSYSDRGDRDRSDRPRYREQGGRFDRAERERPERRFDRPERGERPERAERVDRGERPGRFDRGERAESSERPGRYEKPSRRDQGYEERAGAGERPAKERFAKERPERSDRPERAPSKRSHEVGMVRLVMNTGRDHEVVPGDIVGILAGLGKIPRESIGAIRMMARQAYVDVERGAAVRAIEKLNGAKFKGRQLFVGNAE